MSDTRVIEVLVPSPVQVVEVNPGVPGPQGPAATVTGTQNILAKFDATGTSLENSSITDNGTWVSVNGRPIIINDADDYNAMRVVGAASGGVARLDLWNNNTIDPGVRNWSIKTDSVAFGDLSFYVSSTFGGAPGSGILGFRIDRAGAAYVYGALSSASLAATGTITTSGGGIGYTAGAGGTVAQLSSKSTTVTLNKLCGTITMHDAALNAATTAVFTMNNSTIAAGDFVAIQHTSGGTLGAYGLTVESGAGNAVISIRNVHTASLAESVVLRFVVIKATTA